MPQHNKNRQYDILAVFCYLFVASHKNFQSFHIKRQHRGAFLLQCPGKQLCVRGKRATLMRRAAAHMSSLAAMRFIAGAGFLPRASFLIKKLVK